MATKYTSQSIIGYNATPPADDGSAVESNKVKWATHKTKLADPVKTLAEDIDTALVSYMDRSPLAKSAAYTTTTTDHMGTIETTGTTTITLGAVASMGSGYTVTVKNAGTGLVTIDGNGSETIDGDLTKTLGPDDSMTMVVDNASGAYLVKNTHGQFESGTLMLFQQTAAPTGWTKQTTHNDKALRVVSGTAASGGTNAFSTALNTTFASDSYTLLEADVPAHDHGSAGSHSHSLTWYQDSAFTNTSIGANPADTTATAYSTTTNAAGAHTHTSFGGGGGHSHGMTMDIQYVDLIIASKD